MQSVLDRSQDAASARAAVRRSLDALAGAALPGKALAAPAITAALAGAEAALQARPGFAPACHALGLAALRLGRVAPAIEMFERAHHDDPATREHAEALAITYAAVGRLVDSLYYGKLATALTPSSDFTDLLPAWMGNFADHFRVIQATPLVSRGRTLLAAGQAPGACLLFQQQVELDHRSAPGWRGLAEASLAAGRPGDAVVAYRALCAVEPGLPANRAALGHALGAAGCHDEALDTAREACRAAPDDPAVRATRLAVAVAHPLLTRAAIADEIIACAPSRPALPRAAAAFDGGRPLRVGFLSARFRAGAGLDLVLPVIEERDRADWQAFLYVNGGREDIETRRLRHAASAVTEIGGVDDETAELLIGNDALDVLVDLDLHRPDWRGGLVATHPARLVVGWLGLAETAAAIGYDAMLGDRWTQGAAGPRTLVVPGGVCCLPDEGLPPAPRPAREEGGPVFTTLASPACVTSGAVALWAELLAGLPGAKLVLDPARLGPAAALRARLAEFGVLHQVVLGEGEGSARAWGDVALDLPGAATPPERALDALAAGVPVVTVPGAIPERRQVAGLLGGLGLDAWIAADERDYVAIASRLASPAAGPAAGRDIAARLADRAALTPAARAASWGAALRLFLASGGSV
jgi:predicted O-linked N-acetylglucosamine transferase (SPINDLY family)